MLGVGVSEEAETGSQGEETSLCNDPKVRKSENVK